MPHWLLAHVSRLSWVSRAFIWHLGLDPIKWLMAWILNEEGMRNKWVFFCCRLVGGVHWVLPARGLLRGPHWARQGCVVDLLHSRRSGTARAYVLNLGTTIPPY